MARMLTGIGLIVALLVVLAAASPDHGTFRDARAQTGGQSVTLTARDIAWDKTELTVAPGDTIVLTNVGVLEHNFAVDGVNDDAPVDIPPRDKEQVRWMVPEDLAPGAYTYYCAVPGHRQSGMHGTLTVTGEATTDAATPTASGSASAQPSASGGRDARLQATIEAQATEIADLRATVDALRQGDDHGDYAHGEGDGTATANPSHG